MRCGQYVSVVYQGTTAELTAIVEQSYDPRPFVEICVVTTDNTLFILRATVSLIKIQSFAYLCTLHYIS